MTSEERIEELVDQVTEAQEDARGYRRTLERVADRLAEIGLIDSFPYAKKQFIEGEREI